jgi:soluble lytic murein transglycosylase
MTHHALSPLRRLLHLAALLGLAAVAACGVPTPPQSPAGPPPAGRSLDAAPPSSPVALGEAAPRMSDEQRRLLAEATQLMVEGDYAAAAERWRELLTGSRFPVALLTESRLRLSEALARDGRGPEALDVLGPAAVPDRRDAFFRGLALAAAGQHAEGVAALAAYAVDDPAAGPAVWLEIAELELRARRPREAADAAAKGLEGAAAPSLRTRLLEVRAQALAALGETEPAFEAHRQVLALATDTAALGEQLYRLAHASRELGKRDEAVRALKTALEQFPGASTTADALRLLDDLQAADQVDPYILGRARYAAGDFRNAVLAFDRSLQTEPNGPDAASARLSRALAGLVPGHEAAALRELTAIADDPSQEAEVAARALLEAGQALEGLDEMPAAERQYQALQERFPRLDEAATAGFRLGLARYVRGAAAEAVAAWEALLARKADLPPPEVSRAYYWRGKAFARLGREADARASWEQAAAVRPADYYALRAADRLGALAGSPAAADISTREEDELARWMAGRGLDLAAAPHAVGGEPALARARAAGSLGLYRQGGWEAEELAQRHPDRADRLYWLAREFATLGLPGGAARLGQAALAAAGVQSPLDAPAALRKAAYPRPFARMVDGVAARYGLDPLLLDASFREASEFDAWAESPATGARGLARMTPVQGEEAARGLGLRGAATDLARPVSAVEQQAWYLADRLRRFDGRPEVALAAAANADRVVDGWLVRSAADDPDVFLERMDWEGSRAALRGVLAARLAYAATYGSAAGAPASPLAAAWPKPEPTEPAVKIARLMAEPGPAAPLSPPASVGTPAQQAAFAQGAELQRDGDHEAAAEQLRALDAAAEPAVADEARRRLGEALLGAGHAAEALEPLAAAQAAAPGGSASYLYGRALAETGRCRDAVGHFQRFIAANPGPLAAHGRAALAACLQQHDQHAEAVAQLDQAAQAADLPRLQVLAFRERLALARVRAGDVAGARADYEALLASARTASYRAELSYYLGVLAADPASAAASFRAAVQAAPRSRAAQAALEELVALRDPFAATLEAAETRFEQHRYREALAAYDAVLQTSPDDERAPRARYDRGIALVRLNQDAAGIAALQEVARLHPGSAAAAEGLFRSGRILESRADLDGAAAAYQAVLELPGAGGARGPEAQFRQAFVAFRQGELARAAAGWRDLAGRAEEAADRARASFWLGTARAAAGERDAARAAWAAALDADPGGFYGLRAADHLAGGEAAEPRARPGRPLPPAPQANLTAEVRAWVAARGDPAAAEARLAADPALARAEQLLALGLRREASWELEALADRLGREVDALALLATWKHDHGLYNAAMLDGFRLAGAANVSLLRGAPAVRKLVYPLPHPAALARAGAEQRADPLLFAALVRQESAMDQYAESPAQARGLSQMIASTAHEAARALGRHDFHTAQLFQPRTSLTLGAHTFARRLERYDQRVFPALAAYNAGEYPVDGWLLAAGEADADTFAEAIPFTETAPYVQTIYENYRQYLELYAAQ